MWQPLSAARLKTHIASGRNCITYRTRMEVLPVSVLPTSPDQAHLLECCPTCSLPELPPVRERQLHLFGFADAQFSLVALLVAVLQRRRAQHMLLSTLHWMCRLKACNLHACEDRIGFVRLLRSAENIVGRRDVVPSGQGQTNEKILIVYLNSSARHVKVIG